MHSSQMADPRVCSYIVVVRFLLIKDETKSMISFVSRPLQLSGKCGMTSRFAMETKIHSGKCYVSRGACRLSLILRSVGSLNDVIIIVISVNHSQGTQSHENQLRNEIFVYLSPSDDCSDNNCL